MASVEDDSDLEALRLEVLASLKTRPQDNSPVKGRSTRPDAELENLRSAALQSKRCQDELLWASSGVPKRGFLSKRGYGRNFAPQSFKSRNVTNLIVIQPIPLEENSQQSSSASPFLVRPTDRLLNDDDASQSPRQQRSKNSGKFSRFESDSEESSSESELSESEETAKSQGSSAESGNKSEEGSENEANANDDDDDENVELNDILLLHAEEEPLHGMEEESKNESVTLVNKKTESPHMSSINDDSPQNKETNGTSAVRKSHINSVRGHERNKDSHERRNRRRSKERPPKDGRSRHRDGENRELRKHRFERARHRQEDEKQRKRSEDKNNSTKGSGKSVKEKRGKSNADPKEESSLRKMEFSRGKTDSPLMENDRRGRHNRIPRDVQQNSRSISRESGRSLSPSSKSQPIWPKDLRQKLKSRTRRKEFCSEGEQKSGGNSQSDSEESLGKADRVKSVLGVVKLSSSTSSEPKTKEIFRTSRPKLEPAPLPPTPEEKVRRKPHSPVRIKTSKSPAKTRKVLLVNDGKCFSDDDDIDSKRTRINITLTEDNEEASSKHRVPVHLRLGSLPKSSKSPSKSDALQSSHHHTERGYRSSSPSFVTKAMKRSKGDKGSDDPPRKVKLKRDAFQLASTLSSSIVQAKTNGIASKKSQNESGKTYENELDEKIRRIREQNQAILKRKYEIEEDEQVNY